MVKWIFSAVGIGGAVVGGYYGVEALTNHSIPVVVRNTIEKELKKEGYTIFRLDEDGWNKQFEKFRDGEQIDLFAKILKEGKAEEFKVEKSQANDKGGQALKDWCSEVLDLEIEKVTETKTLANAKAFCAELKKPEEAASADSSSETGRS